jgi:hypothetical protein
LTESRVKENTLKLIRDEDHGETDRAPHRGSPLRINSEGTPRLKEYLPILVIPLSIVLNLELELRRTEEKESGVSKSRYGYSGKLPNTRHLVELVAMDGVSGAGPSVF